MMALALTVLLIYFGYSEMTVKDNTTIIPNKRIGKFYLGMEGNCVVRALGKKYSRHERANGAYMLVTKQMSFWFNGENRLHQIGVTNAFPGKTENGIGLGATMADVKEKYGEFYCENGDYLLKNTPGIAFELGDMDEYDDYWDELVAPIIWIFVYQVISENGIDDGS